MIRATTVGLVTLLACGGPPAVADPATPDEARRLTALFERFIGHPEGQRSAVTVVPHGEAYTATLDITQLFAFATASGLNITAGAFTAELTPRPDGQWHVTMDGFPPIGIAHDDQASSVVLNGYTFDGLFDPAIRAFARATTTTGGSTTHATGKQGVSDIKLTDTGQTTTAALAAGPGLIDGKSVSALKDLTYAITTTPAAAPDAAPSAVAPPGLTTTVTVGGVDTSLSITRQPVVAVEDLWQFLVAHPSKPALIANQAELKARLKAVIPFASATIADLALSKLAVSTSLGDFGLDHLSQHYDFGSPASSGGVAVRVALSGLRLPSGLIPPWAAPLLPTSVDLGQTYGPVDLTPGLLMAIDDLDLAADKPLTDEQQAAILAVLSGADKMVTVAPSTIVLPTMTLKFEGETHLTKPLPTGTATISAAGLDRTIDAVRAAGAGDPMATQVITALLAAKALGKAEGPDSYSWLVAAAPGGDVTVNGTPLSALMQAAPKPRKKPKTSP